jgi:phosphate-selective porin OprO/OprP
MPRGNNDQFYIRSARPILEAKYDDFSARLMMDFGNGTTQLLDAYGDYHAADAFNIRVGKFKDPIGLERWQSEQNVLFVERGMTTNLVPYRDNGVQLYGSVLPGILEYQLAGTNGSPDLVNGTNGADNDQNVTGRIFAHPFAATNLDALKGIGLGVAGSYGTHNGSGASPDLTSGYVTPGQSKFFVYGANAFASGEQWRFNPEATYYNGAFSLLGEYVLESQAMRSGAVTRDIQNDAWMATATYVLTGENAAFDGVVPHNNFDPAHGNWGAFELVGRVSQLHVDDAAFPLFASAAVSAREARESTLGGTWYLNPNVKLNLDFALTTFEGGAATANRPDEKAVLSRAQVKF